MTTHLDEAVFGEALVVQRRETGVQAWVRGPSGAPVLLFTHGASQDHGMFAHQVAAFADRYRVVTWDVEGHGKSKPLGEEFTLSAAASDIVAILDALNAGEAILVGQSMGGMITQHALLDFPERISAACIIGATCITIPLKRWEDAALRWSPAIMAAYPWRTLARQITKKASVTEAARADSLRALEALTRREFLAIWNGVTRGNRPLPGYACDHPLLLIRGTEDRLGVIPKSMPEWARRDPNAQYVEIPGAGHIANMDQPEATNTVIAHWLKSLGMP